MNNKAELQHSGKYHEHKAMVIFSVNLFVEKSQQTNVKAVSLSTTKNV